MIGNKIKFKKYIFMSTIIVLSLVLFSNVLAVGPDITKIPQYDSRSGKVRYIAVSVKASTDIRFRTIGWYPYIKINGRHYGAIAESIQDTLSAADYFKETTKVLEPGQVATHFIMPLTETEDSMIEVIKHAYSVDNGGYNRQVFDDIENVFFQGKTIYLNACITVYHDGLLGGLKKDTIDWNPPENTAEFTKKEAESGEYIIFKPDRQVAFKKEAAMYHMKDKWGNTVHWLQPEKTFENYYDLPVVIQKKPVNKFYFIEYVKIKSDGTYERIKDAQKIDLIMANNVMVTSGIATQLSEEPREIEGLELTRTTVIQVDEPKKELDESVYGDDRYIIYDSSNVRPGDKVTGLFKAIEDIREWKDPHLVLYYKEKGDINANIKTDKNRYNIKVGETARIKISTSAELEDVKEPSRVGELWSSLESVICEGVEYENGGKETKVEKRITVDNPSSDMYKYEISGLSKGIHKVKIMSNAWWIDENGVKSELKSPVEKVVTIVVQSDEGEGGIVFNPKETSWTNEGRESQGKGKYKVNVSYQGDNPFLEAGEIVINKHEEKANPPIVTTNPDGSKTSTPQPSTITDEERTETFEVTFELESISVSGDAQGEFGPDGGDLFIEKEGADLKLNGEGKWGEPQFQLPPLGDGESFVGEPTLPDTPKVPTGEGGVYMLDWTTPVVRSISSTKTDGPINGWTNEGKNNGGYRLDFTVYESDLSGYNETKFTLNDSSYYGRDANGNAPYQQIGEWNTNLRLSDGIYDLDIDLNDIASNTDSEGYGLYKIDHTDPTIEFSMGSNGFDGTLTIADNLSGIYQSNYRWLQHHEDEVGFDYNEYKWREGRPNTYTYFDSGYDQIIKDKGTIDINETTVDGDKGSFDYSVRKPRGDHWYLHVWTRDRAGNVTTRVFSNYDDPIKLKGLKVIDIKDYAWTPQFWNTKVEPKKLKGKKFGPDEMPIDERTNGGIPGINISKGYAVVFEIKSEYLDFREDTIVIKPTFFYLKDGKRIPCDLYYQLERNPFIKYGSKDDKFNVYYTDALKDNVTGTFTRLELEKNERQVRSEEENVWRFKYYIHYNTYAVEKGKKVYAYPTSALKDGEFLIQFDVKAYRNNEVKPHDFWMRYDYIVENWEKEGGNKKAEEPGDVLIFDEHSIIDDYDAGGVH